MTENVSIIDSGKTFTTLVFYTEFLQKLSVFYKQNPFEEIKFKLFQNGDEDIYNSQYRIDPISIPLLLSIFEQLSKFHKKPLDLLLYNNKATIEALQFLFRSGFFKNAGNYKDLTFSSKNILSFDDRYLGAFSDQQIRKDHIVRSYGKEDLNFNFKTVSYHEEILLRDQILSIVSYKVREHYAELLFDNEYTLNSYNLYIDILSELITNGILHSGSTTYSMMFVDRYKSKFSISDNGIGLKKSLDNKTSDNFYYKKGDFRSSVKVKSTLFNPLFVDNLIDIFETLYYSSLKERRGLFDLMLNVVLTSNGYFRLHTDNCQIIISNRIFKYLDKLYECREHIFESHNAYELKRIESKEHQEILTIQSENIKSMFNSLLERTIEYYSEESKYSAIRFFNVKFKGVHIEVEIPNI
jgi:hypothetical protein